MNWLPKNKKYLYFKTIINSIEKQMTNLEKIQNNYDRLGVSSLIYKDFFQINKKTINAPIEKMSYGHGWRIHRKNI